MSGRKKHASIEAIATKKIVLLTMENQTFEYDVVLSFAGESRKIVEPIAALLRDANVSVFYDKFEEAKLWGKNLYAHLSDVYNKKGRYCIIFVTKEYNEKIWTTKEREAAQARALREPSEYILPIKLDDTELPGLEDTISFLDLRDPSTTQEKIVSLVLQKLGRSLLDLYFKKNHIDNFLLKERLAAFNGPPEYWEYTAYLSYCGELKNSSLVEKIKRKMRPHYRVADRYQHVQHGDDICKKAIPHLASSANFLYFIGSNSIKSNVATNENFSQEIELKIALYFREIKVIQGIVPIILPECKYQVVPEGLQNVSCFDLKGNIEKFGEKGFHIPIS